MKMVQKTGEKYLLKIACYTKNNSAKNNEKEPDYFRPQSLKALRAGCSTSRCLERTRHLGG